MNPKVLFLVLAVVVVGGGYLVVQGLDSRIETDEEVVATEETDETAEGGSGRSGGSRVTAMDADGNRRDERRSLADRPVRRGTGAAGLTVTPRTTATASQPSAPRAEVPEDEREQNRSIADLTNLFKSQTDPEARIETAEELGLIDSPEAIRSALELLRDEKDPEVQQALLEAMQGLESQESMADEIFKTVSEIYLQTDNPDVKITAQDLMGDLATEQAAAGLRQVVAGAASGEADLVQINAAENMLRISQGEPSIVTPQEVEVLSQGLKDQYAKGGEAATRQQIIMALATEGKKNAEFFQQALQTEQDPQIRQMLERMVQMWNAPPPATPPPGTVVTPVPTPLGSAI